MAHHSGQLSETMKDEAQRLKLGATGEFPLGKLNSEDEGEIMFGVTALPREGKVVLNFGTPVAWLGFTAEQAFQVSDSIRDKAFEARGITK